MDDGPASSAIYLQNWSAVEGKMGLRHHARGARAEVEEVAYSLGQQHLIVLVISSTRVELLRGPRFVLSGSSYSTSQVKVKTNRVAPKSRQHPNRRPSFRTSINRQPRTGRCSRIKCCRNTCPRTVQPTLQPPSLQPGGSEGGLDTTAG
jgi:hypothetical protein